MTVPDSFGDVGPHPCVLVVDDDPVLRQFVRAVLEGVGYRIEEATDGDEAVSQVAAVNPAVVVLDMLLPGTTGVEVMGRLDTSAIKILMLTGVDDPDVEDSAVAAGALAYLTKPFSPRQLLDQIETLIRR